MLYRPVMYNIHTWSEMILMYDDEVALANRMTDIKEKTIAG